MGRGVRQVCPTRGPVGTGADPSAASVATTPRGLDKPVLHPCPCKILFLNFNIQNLPAKRKNVKIAGNHTMFWQQYWWRRLSLVPNVYRAWHVYWRWTGLKKCACRLSYTPVRRQENLAPSRDRISLSFSAK